MFGYESPVERLVRMRTEATEEDLEWLGKIQQDPVAAMVSVVADQVAAAAGVIVQAVTDAARVALDWIQEHIFKPIAAAFAGVADWIGNVLTSGVRAGVEQLVALGGGESSASLERPIMALVGMGAAMIAITATISTINAAHPFKSLVGESVVAMAYKFLGFERLASAFWSPLMSAAVSQPLRYWTQQTFRPYLPPPREADDAYFEGAINEKTWRETYAMHGWPEEWIDAHFVSMDREPSVMDLVRIADSVVLDEAWARQQLREMNFRDAEIEKLLEVLRRRPLMDEVKLVRQQAMKHYADGLISLNELDLTLRGLGHKEQEIDMLLRAASLMRSREEESSRTRALDDERRAREKELRDVLKERRTVLIEAFRRDLISDSDLVEELIALGLSPDLVGATLELERLRKIPKPKRTTLII